MWIWGNDDNSKISKAEIAEAKRAEMENAEKIEINSVGLANFVIQSNTNTKDIKEINKEIKDNKKMLVRTINDTIDMRLTSVEIKRNFKLIKEDLDKYKKICDDLLCVCKKLNKKDTLNKSIKRLHKRYKIPVDTI